MVRVSLCMIHSWTNNIGRTLLLGLPQKQNGQPVECIMLLTLIFPPKFGLQHLLKNKVGQWSSTDGKVGLWSTTDGKAS